MRNPIEKADRLWLVVLAVPALHRVAFDELSEAAVPLADIVIGLGEREVQPALLARCEGGGTRQKRLERGDHAVVLRDPADLREVEGELRALRRKLDGPSCQRLCLLHIAELEKHAPKRGQHIGIVGFERARAAA